MNANSDLAGSPNSSAEFDEFAERYDATLNRALSVSGEDKNYFALTRINWLGAWLAKLDVPPQHMLDYGCGTGTAIPFLCNLSGVRRVTGLDVSNASLDVARRTHHSLPVTFRSLADHEPLGDVDVAYCNGVFHHIPVAEQQDAALCVFRSLRPGGLFAFWENNPRNPGTRYCMWINPFDRNAKPLSARRSTSLLRAAGFEILAVEYLFIFPKALSWLRKLEPPLCRLPLGAQYQVLCQRPR